jgi:hypothetical protein
MPNHDYYSFSVTIAQNPPIEIYVSGQYAKNTQLPREYNFGVFTITDVVLPRGGQQYQTVVTAGMMHGAVDAAITEVGRLINVELALSDNLQIRLRQRVLSGDVRLRMQESVRHAQEMIGDYLYRLAMLRSYKAQLIHHEYPTVLWRPPVPTPAPAPVEPPAQVVPDIRQDPFLII